MLSLVCWYICGIWHAPETIGKSERVTINITTYDMSNTRGTTQHHSTRSAYAYTCCLYCCCCAYTAEYSFSLVSITSTGSYIPAYIMSLLSLLSAMIAVITLLQQQHNCSRSVTWQHYLTLARLRFDIRYENKRSSKRLKFRSPFFPVSSFWSPVPLRTGIREGNDVVRGTWP